MRRDEEVKRRVWGDGEAKKEEKRRGDERVMLLLMPPSLRLVPGVTTERMTMRRLSTKKQKQKKEETRSPIRVLVRGTMAVRREDGKGRGRVVGLTMKKVLMLVNEGFPETVQRRVGGPLRFPL